MQLLANTTSPYVRIVQIAMIEKGLDPELIIVDPWADDPRLRAANVAMRVPSLILDDGTPLTESILIAQWLEITRPAPQWPSLLGDANHCAGILSRTGVALGGIDASIITLITRKVTAPTLFDDTPIGQRRQRTMIEAMNRVDELFSNTDIASLNGQAPTLDIISAITLFDYQQFRYGDQTWLPKTPRLRALSEAMCARASVRETLPR
jgi:glutathione S-transferase